MKVKIFPIFLVLFLAALPLGYAVTGSIAFNNQQSSVEAGQPLSVISQVQLTSFNQNECSPLGCIIELDPWTYNGQPITYVTTGGILAQSILNLGTYSTSFCNGNPYYAGILTTLGTTNFYQTTFTPKAPLQAGAWTYKVNLYSQCGGNLLLSSDSIPIQVTAATTTPPADVTVFCLSGDKTACSSQLNNCNSEETKYSDLSSCVSNKVVPPTSGTTGTSAVNFEFLQLKKYDLSWWQSFKLPYYTKGISTEGGTYLVTIKNTGTQRAAPLIESYYISKENPFYQNKKYLAEGLALQSIFGTGIELSSVETCKKERGAVYTLSTLEPNQEGTFVILVPYPRSDFYKARVGGQGYRDDMLAGSSNYNKDGQYVLVVSVIDKCDNPVIYDEVGGSVGFKLSSSTPSGAVSGGVAGNTGIDTGITEATNNTPISASARQVTVKREDIKITTSADLLKSACSSNEMCDESVARCEPLQGLIDEGFLTPQLANSKIDETYSLTTGKIIGGASGALIAAESAAVICTPFIAAAGAGLPICFATITIADTLIGGTLGNKLQEFFTNIGKKDVKSVGYCVPKEDTSSGITFKGVTSDIGKGLNDFFGTKGKYKDYTIGLLALVVLAFLFFWSKSK